MQVRFPGEEPSHLPGRQKHLAAHSDTFCFTLSRVQISAGPGRGRHPLEKLRGDAGLPFSNRRYPSASNFSSYFFHPSFQKQLVLFENSLPTAGLRLSFSGLLDHCHSSTCLPASKILLLLYPFLFSLSRFMIVLKNISLLQFE